MVVLIRFGLGFRLVNGSIFVVGRRIDRIKLQTQGGRGIDDVVLGACRYDYGVAFLDRFFFSIHNHLTLTLLNPEELIGNVVDFHADLFVREKAHHHQLLVLSGEKHLSEIVIILCQFFYIIYISNHFYHLLYHYLYIKIQLIWGVINYYNYSMSLSSTVVMVPPERFGFNSQTAMTNTFQRHMNLSGSRLRNRAMEEFKEMVAVLENEKIKVLVLGNRMNVVTPDAVFPNNWFSHHDDGRLVIYPMMAPNRRLERQSHNLKNLLNDAGINHIKIVDLSSDELDDRILEGTGSLVLDRDRLVAFAMESERTNKREFEKWCRIMGYEGVFFHAYDQDLKPVYHTNVVMGLGEKFAVVCLDAITLESERYLVEKKLQDMKKEIIPITLTQMSKFCANILELKSIDKKSKIVMSSSAYEGFTPSQRTTLKKYGALVTVAIPTIETVGGGSARCMIAEIFTH